MNNTTNRMNNTTKRLFAAAFLTAGMIAQTPAVAGDTSELAAAIDKVATAAVAAGESPGLQIAVFKDGDPVIVKGYGSASLELNVPVSNDSVFRIGSVTKQFTSVALLLLAEKGKLSVSDKLSKYYPDFPRANDITLEQMLHHTSGIHSYTSEPNFLNDAMVARTTDEMVDFIAKMPKTQDFEPGTDWSYSNSAYFILGGVVEKAAGKPLATVLKTRLFTPLGMTHSALDDETEIVPGRVAGYAGEAPGEFTNAGYLSLTIPGGAGAIRSSASDLIKWNAALFGGKILKPASLAAMLAPARLNSSETTGEARARKAVEAGRAETMPASTPEYGYGIGTSEQEGRKKIAHGGGIHGFSASLAEYPDDHVTVVVLSNALGQTVGGGKTVGKIERLVLGLPLEE